MIILCWTNGHPNIKNNCYNILKIDNSRNHSSNNKFKAITSITVTKGNKSNNDKC